MVVPPRTASGRSFSRIVEFTEAWQLPIGAVSRLSHGHLVGFGRRWSVLGVAALFLGVPSGTGGIAQSAGPKPADLSPHFGEAADPTVWPNSSVGKLTIVFPNSLIEYCTGALVAPKVVLTAAHCLYPGGRILPGMKLAAPGPVHLSAYLRG